jgi:hypothetical protein
MIDLKERQKGQLEVQQKKAHEAQAWLKVENSRLLAENEAMYEKQRGLVNNLE